MNRPIKFRAWDKKYEEFIYDYRVYLDNHGIPYVDSTIYDMTDITEKVEILRYTGFKDKEGNEIYEGDILTWDGGREGHSKREQDYIIEVLRTDKMWIEVAEHTNMYMFNYDTSGSDYPEYLKDSVVIGNIYENPELLERDED